MAAAPAGSSSKRARADDGDTKRVESTPEQHAARAEAEAGIAKARERRKLSEHRLPFCNMCEEYGNGIVDSIGKCRICDRNECAACMLECFEDGIWEEKRPPCESCKPSAAIGQCDACNKLECAVCIATCSRRIVKARKDAREQKRKEKIAGLVLPPCECPTRKQVVGKCSKCARYECSTCMRSCLIALYKAHGMTCVCGKPGDAAIIDDKPVVICAACRR